MVGIGVLDPSSRCHAKGGACLAIVLAALLAATVFSGCVIPYRTPVDFGEKGFNKVWLVRDYEWSFNGTLIDVNLTVYHTDDRNRMPPQRMVVEMTHVGVSNPEEGDPVGFGLMGALIPEGEPRAGVYLANSVLINGAPGNDSRLPRLTTQAANYALTGDSSSVLRTVWQGELAPYESSTLRFSFNRLEENWTLPYVWNVLEVSIRDVYREESSFTFWRGPCFSEVHSGFYGRLNDTYYCPWYNDVGWWTKGQPDTILPDPEASPHRRHAST